MKNARGRGLRDGLVSSDCELRIWVLTIALLTLWLSSRTDIHTWYKFNALRICFVSEGDLYCPQSTENRVLLVDTEAIATAPSLAERLRDGDSAAEEEFVARYYRRVLLLARVRLRDEQAALDLTQEAVFGALLGIKEGRLHCHEQLGAYVYGTARNLINNHFRRSEPPSRDVSELLQSDADGPDQVVLDRERQVLVRQALDGFNPVDRAILGMTLLEGMKPNEIATRLGMKPELVRKRKSRAVKKVRDVIQRTSRKSKGGHLLNEERL